MGERDNSVFSIGQQFSTISLLATTSMTQVFWKEIAAATASGDRDRAAKLYRSTSGALYFVAAWVGSLLIPYSREILSLTVVGGYTGAATAFALMLLYPVHQSMGRVGGAFLYAVGDTALYSRVGVLGLISSVPIAYLLLAPRSAVVPGLGLGAVGLTIKMIAVNVTSVNLQAYAIARRLGTTYDWRHHVLTLGCLLALAFGCRFAAQELFGVSSSAPGLAAAIVGAAAYTAASAVLLVRRPAVVGLTPAQASAITHTYRQLLRIGTPA